MTTISLNRQQRRTLLRQKRSAQQPNRNLINVISSPVWQAMSRDPMDQAKQVNMAIDIHSAFAAIIAGTGTLDDVNSLAFAANIGLVLAERGYGPELLPNIVQAQHALVRTLSRHQQGKSIGFDGPGAQAIRDLLDTHTQQHTHAGKAEVSEALLEVYRRGKTNSMEVPA